MIDAKLDLAGQTDIWSHIESLRQNSLDYLAPAMRAAVVATLKHAQGLRVTVRFDDGRVELVPLDPIVHETLRTQELQNIYYAMGATHARTAEKSWHFYGLAVDVISIEYGWFTDATARRKWPKEADRGLVADCWFRAMAAVAGHFMLASGLDWPTMHDAPHLQWIRCARSPEQAPAIYQAAGGQLAGRQAVWRAVGADIVPSTLAEDAA